MATTIEIYIRGLAFCYYEEATKLWKVIFLCEKSDTEHQLLFSYTGWNPLPDDPYKKLYNRKKIEFTVNEANQPSNHKGEKFGVIFNVVKDAHKDNGIVWNQTVSEEFNIIEMSIPAAQLYTKKETAEEYLILKKKGNVVKKPKPLRPVADTVGARIMLKDTGSLSLKIDDEVINLGFDYTVPNATYEIRFDNNCDTPNPLCGSPFDSLLYYELFEDAKMKNLQYIATRGAINKDKHTIFSPEGNCDPVASDPPPGGGNR